MVLHPKRRWFPRQSGQAIVEFMLTTVFLVVVFLCVLQMIMLMYAYSTLADAAKEGLRYAIVHGTGNNSKYGGNGCSGPGTSGITCSDPTGSKYVVPWVMNFASLSLQNVQTTDVTVDYNPNSANGKSGCSAPGCLVQVTVGHQYSPFFGLPWPSITLYASASGRIMN